MAEVFDPVSSVARRFVQIDDDSIQATLRIHFAVEFADDFLLGTGERKRITDGERFLALNDEASEHGWTPWPML